MKENQLTGLTDLWGKGWTSEDVNSPRFGEATPEMGNKKEINELIKTFSDEMVELLAGKTIMSIKWVAIVKNDEFNASQIKGVMA